jgi:hypothetical protein
MYVILLDVVGFRRHSMQLPYYNISKHQSYCLYADVSKRSSFPILGNTFGIPTVLRKLEIMKFNRHTQKYVILLDVVGFQHHSMRLPSDYNISNHQD